MKKFNCGFSLQNAFLVLVIVLLTGTLLPIVLELFDNNEQIEDSSNIVFQKLKDEYLYSNTSYAGNGVLCAGLVGIGGVLAGLCEPIILDLNSDGVMGTTSIKHGIYLDFDNDGFAEKMSWANKGDGILIIDLNSNNTLDSGEEVIISSSLQNQFPKNITLNSLDSNNDGVIDSKDEKFRLLKISKNNKSLISLQKAGVKSINTSVKKTNFTDEHGNNRFEEGTFVRGNNTIGVFGDYWLQSDPSDSVETNILKTTNSVSRLPDIKSRGKVHSLHQAMIRDKELENLVTQLVSEKNESEKIKLLEKIMLKWTGGEKVPVNSRGKNVNAQHLFAVEKFMGSKYGVSSDEDGETVVKAENPNVMAGNSLETIYVKLSDYVYAEIMSQTQVKDLVKLIRIKNNSYDYSKVVKQLEKEILKNTNSGKSRVLTFAKVVKGFGLDKRSNFFDVKDENCFYQKFTSNDRDLKWQIDKVGKQVLDVNTAEIADGENKGWLELKGTKGEDAIYAVNVKRKYHYVHSMAGSDVIYGGAKEDVLMSCTGNDIHDSGDGDDEIFSYEGNDTIFAGAGNDTIRAGEGDDVIFGGEGDDVIYPDHQYKDENNYKPGNDTIIGGKGNDTIYDYVGDETYIFNSGDGKDVIYDKEGEDRIVFGKGIKWNDLIFERRGNDMSIKIKGTTDEILVKDWYASNQKGRNNNRIERFEFSDGTIRKEDNITLKN